MVTRLIGIDCATQAKNVGLACGLFKVGEVQIEEVLLGGKGISIVDTVAGWLSNTTNALIALDAPLGWPLALGAELHRHAAGEPIHIEPNQLFRRETDLFIKRMIGKQPLDVGADRIARTAQAALVLLDEIRKAMDRDIPLAWEPGETSSLLAIEVYPAATLIAHAMQVPGYKRVDGQEARKELVRKLGRRISLPDNISLLEENDDAIDAAVCVLAAADFLRAEVYAPTDLSLARIEGWIWVREGEGIR